MKNASDSKRLALVLGCSEYTNFNLLNNAVNDAEAVRKKLESFGFRVECAKNPNYGKMVDMLGAFTSNLSEDMSDVVIYFAGHGCNIRESFLGFMSPLSDPEPQIF